MKYLKLFESKEQDLIDASINWNLAKVKELIKAGVDINHQNKNGNTALILSLIYNNIEIVEELISAGADWNIKNNSNYDFFDYLTLENKQEIIKEFPEEYELYLLKKANKYNL